LGVAIQKQQKKITRKNEGKVDRNCKKMAKGSESQSGEGRVGLGRGTRAVGGGGVSKRLRNTHKTSHPLEVNAKKCVKKKKNSRCDRKLLGRVKIEMSPLVKTAIGNEHSNQKKWVGK